MSAYSSLFRPLLFRLPADQSHDLARMALSWPLPWRLAGGTAPDPRLATDLAGVSLQSPVGLAPGFDKDGQLIGGLSQLGFSYLTIGSITSQPRAGNPKPRLVRNAADLSVQNCMGMPNVGLESAIRLVDRSRQVRCPVIASVAGFSARELLDMAALVEPHVAAVEIGLICDNTPGMEQMGELEIFTELVGELGKRKRRPVFIKLPPHHDEPNRRRVRAMVEASVSAGMDGVSVSGTRHVPEPRLSMQKGGMAGRPVYADALRIVADVADWAGGRLAIKAAGGVFTGEHAYEMLRAGATTVEVYSAFIYRGWGVAGHINRELLEVLDRRGLASVRDVKPGSTAAV